MYYESRIHEERNCENLQEVARLIKTGKASGHESLTINGFDGNRYHFVADQPFGSFDETAVIRQEPDGKFIQIESITAAWVKSAELLEKCFRETLIGQPAIAAKTQLMIGEAAKTAMAYFTCGCCGSRFKGNVIAQKAFDQDDGYGICNSCSKYY